MFKSSRKKLIAIGCSYTDHYLNSVQSPNLDFDFPRWPQHLADMLDMECVNLGKAGMGNEYMLAKVLEVLDEKNIGLVVIMWSEWQRLDFQTKTHNWDNFHPHRDNSKVPRVERFPINLEARQAILKYFNFKARSMRNLRTFFIVQEVLKNVQYLMIQGTQNFSTDVMYHEDGSVNDIKDTIKIRKRMKEFISEPLFDKIDEKKFIGWPIFREIGGYCVDNILDDIDPSRNIYRMSKEDSHPNDKGHKCIGEMLFNEYKKIYI